MNLEKQVSLTRESSHLKRNEKKKKKHLHESLSSPNLVCGLISLVNRR